MPCSAARSGGIRSEDHVHKTIRSFSVYGPLIIVLAGSATLTGACRESAPQGAAVAPIAVSTAPVSSTALASSMEAGGVVTSRTTAVIASRIMAPVAAVHVRAGDRVRRGAPLVTLDGRELDANRARAIATLASAAESQLAAESELRSAQAALTLARATHDRIRTLHGQRSATPQELDQAVSALDVADAQFKQAQARRSAANAAHDAARAASDGAGIASSYATLSAPFDGVVTERAVDPGSMANPGTPLVTIEEGTAFRVEVSLDESRAASVKIGDTVTVRVDQELFPDPLSGRVSEIARVDPAAHSFIVKIDLPAVTGLRSGLFARARFTGSPRTTLTVPTSAAIRRGQLTFVFAVDSEHRARLRAVSPGITDGARLEILAGLRANDIVIITPPPSLTDGAAIAGSRR
jgi:multidrug efflux pump subunit AcrA (membrane-fusion protein)